ncbi:MAG: rod shape-determining protein MreC [Sphingomonas sanxanigenens]|uniref:Cell shape-determining protein MreC n=1 Tax=Sphingomonas sanxanigenens TaxID=397260 RepID=A0A2W5AEZ7_9SPHN|nr:MAG: rod shape-determining protein MreC [Sphingomonas sanxanigenens]
MAPPRNRRPGYSRRAQYGLFIGYVATIAGAVFALLLIAAAIFDPTGFGAIRAMMSDLTAPISGIGRSAARGGERVVDEVAAYINAGSKNRALTAELEQHRIELARARAIEAENVRLKAVLRVTEKMPQRVAIARLVSSSLTSSRRFAVMNAGYADGVRAGMPVRAAAGLIGRVVAVGHTTAQIALLTDGGTVVPVRRAKDGLPAIATGTGEGAIDLRALGAGDNPFKAGDVFVTSGVGGVYAPDIPVAVVVRVAGDQTVARPLADPAQTDFAIVEPLFQPAIEKPLAPPPAAPARQ